MNFNMRMINLKNDIIKLIGESQLPVGVVYYILKDLFDDITNAYNQSLALEQSLLESNNNSNENIDKDSDKSE